MRWGIVILAFVSACAGGKGSREEIAWKRSFTYGSPPVQLIVNLDGDSLTASSMLNAELVLEAAAAARPTPGVHTTGGTPRPLLVRSPSRAHA